MNRQEYELEKRCKDYARRQGWVIWKNVPDGCKGVPDTSLLSPDGRFIMVEFKRDAHAKIRPEQVFWQNKFPDKIYFISSYDDFTALISRK